MALSNADLQSIAQKDEGGAAFVYHVDPVGGSDGNDGSCWASPKLTVASAITTAVSNYLNKLVGIRYGAGTLDLSTNGFINFQTSGLGPVKFRGLGKRSIIRGAKENAPLIWVGSGCEIDNFQLISDAATNTFNYLVGDAGSNVSDVLIQRLFGRGTTDCLYFSGNSQYDCQDSVLQSLWDTFYNQGNIVARLLRCMLQSLGPHSIAGAAHVQGIGQSVFGAFTSIQQCSLSLRATNSDAGRQAYGVHTQTGGLMELHGGTSILCAVPNGGLVDLEADSGSEIRAASNCSFNRARSAASTGTLTFETVSSDLWKIRGIDAGPLNGLGPFAMIVHVVDVGGANVSNAKVSIIGTGNSGWTTTDANGLAALNLDAGVVSINAAADGYSATVPVSDTITASGNAGLWSSNASSSRSITLTALTIPPATTPDTTNAFGYTHNGQGALQGSVTINFRLIDPGQTTDIYSLDVFTATSDVNGRLIVPLLQAAKYSVQTADGSWVPFTTGTATTYQIPIVLGAYA